LFFFSNMSHLSRAVGPPLPPLFLIQSLPPELIKDFGGTSYRQCESLFSPRGSFLVSMVPVFAVHDFSFSESREILHLGFARFSVREFAALLFFFRSVLGPTGCPPGIATPSSVWRGVSYLTASGHLRSPRPQGSISSST